MDDLTLSRKETTRRVSLLDLSILLWHLQGAVDKWGNDDADRTVKELNRLLDRGAVVPTDVLESALASLNQTMEAGLGFFSPDRRSFNDFLRGLTGSKEEYDRLYQHFVRKGT